MRKKIQEYAYGYSDCNRIKWAVKADLFRRKIRSRGITNGDIEYTVSFSIKADQRNVYWDEDISIRYNHEPSKLEVIQFCLSRYRDYESRRLANLVTDFVLNEIEYKDTSHKYKKYNP